MLWVTRFSITFFEVGDRYNLFVVPWYYLLLMKGNKWGFRLRYLSNLSVNLIFCVGDLVLDRVESTSASFILTIHLIDVAIDEIRVEICLWFIDWVDVMLEQVIVYQFSYFGHRDISAVFVIMISRYRSW